jgi:hypothetical protein
MEPVWRGPDVPELVSDNAKAVELRRAAERLIEHIEEHIPTMRCSDAYAPHESGHRGHRVSRRRPG